MKKQITRKLTLSKETLRNLSERELQGALGAGPTVTSLTSNPTLTQECSMTFDCSRLCSRNGDC